MGTMNAYGYQAGMSDNDMNREGRATLRARNLFNRVYFAGQLKGLLARLTGRSRALRALRDVQEQVEVRHHVAVGIDPVRIERIIGSRDKAGDFDRDWLPLTRNTEGRWVSVATGTLLDFINMPPVELVQVGEDYYVLDGHHRISAARALGYIYINADVTRWDVEVV